MNIRTVAAAFTAIPLLLMAAGPALAAMQQGAAAPIEDIWKPAKTPPGGTSWTLLEATKMHDRTDSKTGMIFTKPLFPAAVKALAGKEIIVAGWMMPLENSMKQSHFVLLGYPPGCPFHMHALPNQFIEVYASTPLPIDQMNPIVIRGTLELSGQDESGIFYRLRNARAG